MALVLREHIKLPGDNPLNATVVGTHYIAYLVVNLILNDGPQAATDHYSLPLASVYGALAFHYDNEAAIDEAIQEARKLGRPLRASSPREYQGASESSVSYIRKRFSIDLNLATMRHWPACPPTNTGPIFPKASVKALVRPPIYQIIHSCHKHMAAAEVSSSRSSSLDRKSSVMVIHSLGDTSNSAT